MFFRVPIAILALAWPRFSLAADPVQCFNPDGSKAEGDVPCFRSGSSLSRVCCAPNQICSTNGLCVNKASSPSQTFRGSCLDPAFGPSCPTYCTGISKARQLAVISCGDPKAGTFCCDEGKGSECCNTPSKILALGVGTLFSEGTMGTMSNAPAAQSPQPPASMQVTTLISISTVVPSASMQITTVISILTVTATQAQATPVSQSSSTGMTSATTPAAPILPPIPVASLQSQKGEERARPTGPSAPFGEARTGIEAALIAEAAVRQPAVSSAPPLSAVTIASAAIGGVVIMTLIVVVSVIVLRWRAARKAEESQDQETASGANPQDEEKGGANIGGTGPPVAERGVVEIGGPNGFTVPDRSMGAIPIMPPNAVRLPENPFRSPLPSPRWPNEDGRGNMDRRSEYSAREYNRNSDPFNGGTPIPPPALGNEMRNSVPEDSPIKGYYNDRQSEWSHATLTFAYPGDSPHVDRTRGVTSLDREVDELRSRYPEQHQELNQAYSGTSNLRDPPTIETSNGLRVPAAGLERRVSGEGPGTMNSQTFQKLLYDVQSRPF